MRKEEKTKKPARTTAVPWALIAVVLAMAFTAYVRLRYLDVPLERDEGEYAYAGSLILDGVPPYSIAYNMKFPGTYYAYALILALFGRTTTGIHLGLLFINEASIVLVYVLGRRLAGGLAAGASGIAFAILTIDPATFGVFAHATHFVVVATLAGFLLLLRAMESRRAMSLAAAGALLGLAVLMKQHAIFYLPLAAVLLLWMDHDPAGAAGLVDRARRVGIVAAGSVVPIAVVSVVLASQGVFDRFWFWTFRYARAYVSEVPLGAAWALFKGNFGEIARPNLAFWILGLAGLLFVWITSWPRRTRIFLTGLLAASALAVVPGFYFRGHYFIVVLPAIALLGGIAVASIDRFLASKLTARTARAVAIGIVALAAAMFVIPYRDYAFHWSSRELSRRRYGSNPFVETVEVARYIKEHTKPDERIAVLGSEPEIYFYADRKSATGYIYTYALVEAQPYATTMQKEMIRQIEAARPRYLVFAWIRASWLPQPGSDDGIFKWATAYMQKCYNVVGVMDIYSKDATNAVWGDAAKTYTPVSDSLVFTLVRRSDDACSVE